MGLSWLHLPSRQVDCYLLKPWTDRNETKSVRKIMILPLICTKLRSIWFGFFFCTCGKSVRPPPHYAAKKISAYCFAVSAKKKPRTKSIAASCISTAKSLSFEQFLFRFDRSKFLGGSSQLVAKADEAKKDPHWSKRTGITCILSGKTFSIEHI